MSVMTTSVGKSIRDYQSKVTVQHSKKAKDIVMDSSRVAEDNNEISALNRQNDLGLDLLLLLLEGFHIFKCWQ